MMRQAVSVVLMIVASAQTSQSRQARPLSYLTVSISDQFPPQLCLPALHNLNELITSSSQKLHNLTSLQIHKVTVILPPSWYNTSCTSGILLSSISSSLTHPDIFLSNGDESRISVTQYGGCGEKGRSVTIPAGSLHNDFNDTQSSDELLDSLLKYQFGVFATHGQVDDQKFPETYKLGEQELENCEEDHYEETFYNSEAPTKQNLLCNGQSPISVIKSQMSHRPEQSSHPDYIDMLKTPKLEYVISHSTRYLLVLDRSMQAEHMWIHLHNALYRFISTIPVGDEVSVITFGRQSRLTLPPTKVTEANRVGIHSRITGKVGSDAEGCLECALREASQLIAESEIVKTKIVIVSASNSDNQNELKRSLESLSKRSEVFTLLVGKQRIILDLEMKDNLQTFSVNEVEQNSVDDLYDILSLTITNDVHVRSNQSVKFYSDQFSVKSNERVSGKFVVENSMRLMMTVMTTTVMKEDIEMFQLTSPSGSTYQFPTVEKGQVYFQFPQLSEPGVWTYLVKLTPNTIHPTVPVRVSAYAQATEKENVKIEGWTGSEVSGPKPGAVTLYARLTDELMAVSGAEVIAIVSRPDGDRVEVVLHDSGTGYPDIAIGDGIYSAYFTDFSQLAGLYSIRIIARNHEGKASVSSFQSMQKSMQCGSEYAFTAQIPSLHFTRFTRTPSFFLAQGVRYSIKDGVPHRKDVYPPARITDLQASLLPDISLQMVLTWTATGDDYDKGRAERYELRWSEDRISMMEDKYETEGTMFEGLDLPAPGVFGAHQSYNLTTPKENTVLYFGLVAIDATGNRSPVSNLINIYVKSIPQTPEAGEMTDENKTKIEPSSALTLPSISTNVWVYILSISMASVSLIIIMFLIIIIRKRKLRKHQENCAIPYFIELGPPGPPSNTDNSCDHQLSDKERPIRSIQHPAPNIDFSTDTLSYPSPCKPQHPVLDLYQQHKNNLSKVSENQISMEQTLYQNIQASQSESCRSSSSGSERSDRESPSESDRWRMSVNQFRDRATDCSEGDRQEVTDSSNSDSQTSSLCGRDTSHNLRQSRRRRENFV